MATKLDLARLEQVRRVGNKTIARCPACAEAGGDKDADHLLIAEDGKYGCVKYPGLDGQDHRKRIFALVGQVEKREASQGPQRKACTWTTSEQAARACIPKGATYEAIFEYPLNGKPFAAVGRYRLPDDKTFLQFHANDSGWKSGGPSGLWPLYRVDAMPSTGALYIVEGEKCQHAAASIELSVVTSAGGAMVPHKSDWRPLAGRDVTILPDNDEPGEQYAKKVAEILSALKPPARVRVVRLPGLPEHGDIADYLEARDAADPETLRAEIERMAANAEPSAEAASPFGPIVPLEDVGRLPPFPFEVLPGAFCRYVSEVAESRQVAPDLPAVLALGVAAVACAKRYKVEIGHTHTEPLNIYTLPLVDPGERKSAVFRDMLAPVEDCERLLREAAAPVICRAEERRRCEEVRLTELRKRAGREDDRDRRNELMAEAETVAANLTPIPAPPRLLTGDCTSERLVSLMAENGGRIAQADAEGGCFFNLIGGQYSKNGAGNFEVYLRAHPGDALRVDRTTRPGESISEPALTLILTGQPDLLRDIPDRERLRGRGLLARFLFSLPPAMAGGREYRNRPVDPIARASYERAVSTILETSDPATPESPNAYNPLRIEGEALDVWAKSADETERALGPDGLLSHARDWGAKLAGAVARVAGLLHVMSGSNAPSLAPATVADAWAVGRYFQAHTLAAFALMNSDPRLVLARRILGWIRRHGRHTFKLSDLFRSRVGGEAVAVADDLLPGLLVLSERGYCRTITTKDSGGPGRKPSPSFEVNPATHAPK